MIKFIFIVLAVMAGKMGCSTEIQSRDIHIADTSTLFTPCWGAGYTSYPKDDPLNLASEKEKVMIHLHINCKTYIPYDN